MLGIQGLTKSLVNGESLDSPIDIPKEGKRRAVEDSRGVLRGALRGTLRGDVKSPGTLQISGAGGVEDGVAWTEREQRAIGLRQVLVVAKGVTSEKPVNAAVLDLQILTSHWIVLHNYKWGGG